MTSIVVTGKSEVEGPPLGQNLSPQMMEAAILRLRWISLAYVGVMAFLVCLRGPLEPESQAMNQGTLVGLVFFFVLLVALGISLIGHYRVLAPVTLLRVGLGFEIVVAAAISFEETALIRASDGQFLGVSTVALWIGVVGLLVPNKPWIKLGTALASASTWPAAYLLNLFLLDQDPLPWNRLFMWIYVPYVVALANYGIATRIWRGETTVQRTRQVGSYHLVSVLGSGGMGEVWRARHGMLARDVAIKVIRPELMTMQPGRESDITRRRFEREARAISMLHSPHTVHLHEYGVAEDGSLYYVMELLDGISLQSLVDRFGPQPASRVIHILRQLCESLEEAHRQGLIHCDIKPENIVACMEGIEYDFMKVLDFGLVRNVSPQKTVHSMEHGLTAGTPAYMAPEIAMGEESLDGRVDIYALGCVAYFLLTGLPVFDEKTPTATALAHVHRTPLPPSERKNVPVPQRLEELVLRCLAKQPEGRPQSAMELIRLLKAITEVPEWTQEDAENWWQTFLPSSDPNRRGCQPRPVESDLVPKDETAKPYGVVATEPQGRSPRAMKNTFWPTTPASYERSGEHHPGGSRMLDETGAFPTLICPDLLQGSRARCLYSIRRVFADFASIRPPIARWNPTCTRSATQPLPVRSVPRLGAALVRPC